MGINGGCADHSGSVHSPPSGWPTEGGCDVPMRMRSKESILADRVRAVHARGRISESLLGVALDVIEPYASDYLSPDEYRRVCELVREPVEDASEAALVALIQALVPTINDADPGLLAQIESVRGRSL